MQLMNLVISVLLYTGSGRVSRFGISLRLGIPKVELSSRLKLGNYLPVVLESLTQQGSLVEEEGHLRLPSHTVQLTPAQQQKIDAFLKSLADNPYAPPGELIPEPNLVNLLIERGRVVKVSDNVIFAAAAYREMVEKIKAQIREKGKISVRDDV
jgi:hypothetical protein